MNPVVASVARYPHRRYLECRRCRTMTLHEAVDAMPDARHANLLWGEYWCLDCCAHRRETMSVRDYEALRAKLSKEA